MELKIEHLMLLLLVGALAVDYVLMVDMTNQIKDETYKQGFVSGVDRTISKMITLTEGCKVISLDGGNNDTIKLARVECLRQSVGK